MMAVDIQAQVISLASAVEKRAAAAGHFEGCPFQWAFFEASDGSRPALPYRRGQALKRMGRELERSELGCFDSHYRVLREFRGQASDQFLLVCEDDVRVDFSFDFEALARAMQKANVDYIRLYSRRVPSARHIAYWRNRWLIRYRWEPFGTQCYLVSARGAQRLTGNLTFMARPIDNEFDRFWENGLPSYSLFPHPVLEIDSPSSIVRDRPKSSTRLHWMRYRALRVLDRAAAVRSSLRGGDLDQEFTCALRQQDVINLA